MNRIRKINITKCSECGSVFHSIASGITGDNDGFVCSPCYRDFLCPSPKANDMEIIDEKEIHIPTRA
jgi:hypothetical protein